MANIWNCALARLRIIIIQCFRDSGEKIDRYRLGIFKPFIYYSFSKDKLLVLAKLYDHHAFVSIVSSRFE
jgi:hypothetical protein